MGPWAQRAHGPWPGLAWPEGEDAKIKKIQRKYKNNLKLNNYYINNVKNNTKLGAAFGRPQKGGAAAFGRRPPFLGSSFVLFFTLFM